MGKAPFLFGVDEVGRGCLAGPTCVGVVLADSTAAPDGLDDSKKLSKTRREALIPEIKAWAIDYEIGSASATEVDELGILPALRLAAERAFTEIFSRRHDATNTAVILDGTFDFLRRTDRATDPALLFNAENLEVTCVAKADALYPAVSAASVLAKVYRDDLMAAWAQRYPGYGFERNAGYGSQAHRDAIKDLGLIPGVHRASWCGKFLKTSC